EFDILYGQGISKTGEIIDIGTDLGLIDKSGAWYSYKGERIGQGRENARIFLQENRTMHDDIEGQIRKHFGLSGESEATPLEQPSNVTPIAKPTKKSRSRGGGD
ncbi:MAG: DNA recombination/repair protein RecA, partial [Myxococcota bacterium]